MTSTAYPRVLIVAANPLNRVQSAGLMMRSLFGGWPRERLAQIYFPFLHSFPPDADTCARYLRVNPIGIARLEEFPSPARRQPGHQPPEEGRSQRNGPVRKLTHKLARNRSLRAPLVDPLRETLALYPWLDHQILNYARSFKPDVIYTLLGTLAITRAVARIADELDCPVVPHFTDNWIDTRFVGSPFCGHLRNRLRFWLDRVLAHAEIVLGMSGVTAQEYQARFGKQAHFFTRLVDEEPYRLARQESSFDDSELHVLYAGSLGLRRAEVLKLVGHVLQRLANEGLAATLEVYCPESDRELYGSMLKIPSAVNLHGWASTAELPALLARADVLLHIESPDPEILPYIRFAFSTKLSEYMMAGRCLLLVGPSEAGSLREIKRMDAGVVVESTDPGEIEDALRRTLGNRAFRSEMARRARVLGVTNYATARHRERFRRLLSDCSAR